VNLAREAGPRKKHRTEVTEATEGKELTEGLMELGGDVSESRAGSRSTEEALQGGLVGLTNISHFSRRKGANDPDGNEIELDH
jgi:hypothetical protein